MTNQLSLSSEKNIAGNTQSKPLRTLMCACCGGYTMGRQWHNQDAGWGLCNACVTRCFQGCGNSEIEFERTYGTRGVHCDIPPYSIVFEDFAKFSTINKLLNHGRNWEVFFNGKSYGFADAIDEEDALREVHESTVNNALYANSDEAPEWMHSTLPPQEVLAEYPDLAEKYSVQI